MSPEYLVAGAGLLVALLGSLGTFLNSLTRRRTTFGDEDEQRLKDYDVWRPKVRRAYADLVDRLASHEDPDTIPGLPELPKREDKKP
jgi:hypothetical protein